MPSHKSDYRQAKEWTASAGKRRTRLATVDLRERILTTAVDLMMDSGGLTASLAHLNMEELIRIADVPRSSVYRAWGTSEAFYVDLMERMVAPDQRDHYIDALSEVTGRVLRTYRDRLTTEDDRRAVLREVIRCAVGETFQSAARSLVWRSGTALTATLPALEGEDRDRIQEALTRSQERFVGRLIGLYRDEVMPVVGARVKDGFNLTVVVSTVSSTIDGLIRRRITNPTLVDTPIRQPGIDGADVDWSLPAVAVMAIIDAMVELDPVFTPPVDVPD